MKLKYFIFMGISITVFLMGVIVYPAINTVSFDDYFSSHDVPTALADMPQIVSEESSPKFIDFSYANIVGEPIKFVLEKTSYSRCNSYNAKITDEDGNAVWEERTFALCDPPNSTLITSQIKIGYNEDNPITINESGKYHLEVELDDIFTKREFVVRQNHGGGTLDRTDYPIPFDMPSPHKQMELGIKLGHIICDKDKVPVWNTHYKPACVYPDTESELIQRGWAKLRLLLPAGPDPVKEMEWTGRNVMSMMLEGTFSYSSTPVETLDEKRKAIEEYSKQYHQGEQYLEYAITPHQDHYNVGNKVQFELLEWGISADCSNPQLRIIDINNQSVFENSFDKICVDHDGTYGNFNSYSMGDDFEEFVCDKTGYYRIEVSNGNLFSPSILQNFACLDSEPVPDLVVKHNSIPSVQEFLQMDCEDLNHLYPEFPSEEVADAWITRMHECLNEQENDEHKVIELFKNTPEVKAFHMQYEDAQTSVREDYVSYFSGSEDGYLVRMNLYFDENYVLTNTDFHCYYQKVHQFEMPQEDIATTLSKYDCKTYSEMNNEN